MGHAVKRFAAVGRGPGRPVSGLRAAPGEGQDPYYSLAFGDIDPFDVETLALAEAIYGPMLYHMETVKA